MTITVPQELLQNGSTLSMDGISVAAYRITQSELSAEVYVSSTVVTFIFEGQKELTSPETRKTILEGDFVFIQKGRYVMSSIVPSKDGAFSSLLLFLDDAVLNHFISENSSLFEGITAEDANSLYHGKSSSLLNSSAKSFLAYFEDSSFDNSFALRHKLYEILLNIISLDSTGEFRKSLLSSCNKKGGELRDYMDRNYYLPLTVEEFAKNTFRSLSTFKKEFREQYSSTPKSWINKRRLEKAELLLRTSDRTVTETCFLCGFDSLSHFIQLFREQYGITPKQHQNQNR